jgi:hypothetical protein
MGWPAANVSTIFRQGYIVMYSTAYQGYKVRKTVKKTSNFGPGFLINIVLMDLKIWKVNIAKGQWHEIFYTRVFCQTFPPDQGTSGRFLNEKNRGPNSCGNVSSIHWHHKDKKISTFKGFLHYQYRYCVQYVICILKHTLSEHWL